MFLKMISWIYNDFKYTLSNQKYSERDIFENWRRLSDIATKRDLRIVCRRFRLSQSRICRQKRQKERQRKNARIESDTLREVLAVQSNKPFPASCLRRRLHFFPVKLWIGINPTLVLDHKNKQKMNKCLIIVKLEVILFRWNKNWNRCLFKNYYLISPELKIYKLWL